MYSRVLGGDGMRGGRFPPSAVGDGGSMADHSEVTDTPPVCLERVDDDRDREALVRRLRDDMMPAWPVRVAT